jgi:hypothetical protein
MAKSNYDVLVDAGIIPDDCYDQFSTDDLTCIEDLSDAEIAHLITTFHKLGRDFFEEHPHGIFF